MKLFRKRKPENGEEADDLFDADAVEEDVGPEMAEAAASPAAEAEPPPATVDPLAQMRAEAAGETAAAEKPSEGGAPSPQPDNPLDAGLMDLFREAKNEVEESTLASELPDIPIQDLLSDLMSVSQDLGITPRVRAQPRRVRAVDSEGEHRASRE